MLIRSQDKKSLVNLNNTCQLFIGRSNDTNTKIYADFQDGISDAIGTYSTEAKAIKVLDAIASAYTNTESNYRVADDSYWQSIRDACLVLEMPSDEEVEDENAVKH